MFRLLLTATVILTIFSCNKKSGTDAESMEPVGKYYVPKYNVSNFEGTYTGSFDKGFLTLVINYVAGKNVSGYNLHKGLRRNINGTLSEDNGKFSFELKEPGDNPFDGTFSFSIDTSTFAVSGMWKPFDSSRTSSKQIALIRKPADTSEYPQYLGTYIPASGTYATDTLLQFDPNGTVEYNFYQKPGDSTSQMLSVKGNYVMVKDTITIEWQKNDYTPAQTMKLMRLFKKIKEQDYEYDQEILTGHGWKLTQFMGD